jgi:putative holliday junction resolvase
MTYLSIDYWTHKSWLAYSVEGFAFAIETVPTKELIGALDKLVEKRHPQAIIIGMPYHIDGTMSKHGQRVMSIAKILEKHFVTIPVIFHDERLTSSEAHLAWADDIDAESARLILEDYLRMP